MSELFSAERLPVQCADKSSWDWTVQPWVAELVSDLLVDLLVGDSQIIRTVAKNHCMSMLSHQKIDLNGLKLQFRNVGRLPSGWLFTIFFNCIGQSAVDALACLRTGSKRGLLKAMGDDTIQTVQPERYWKELRTLCLIKQVDTYRPGQMFEFCGTIMNKSGGTPSKRNSHAFRLHFLQDDVRDETLQSYLYLYACDPQAFGTLSGALVESAPERVIPQRLALSWYRGEPAEV
nr:MAG: protease polymerase P70 [Chemarfal virus 255]